MEELNLDEVKIKKNIKPKQNVLYTFAFDNGKLTFKFVGTKPNGTYIMREVKSKTPALMTPARFSYLYKYLLIEEKEIEALEDGAKPKKQKEPPKTQEKKKEAPTGENNTFNIDEMIKKVLSLNDIQNKRLFMLLGKDKTDIASDIETRLLSAEKDVQETILKDYKTAIKITTV